MRQINMIYAQLNEYCLRKNIIKIFSCRHTCVSTTQNDISVWCKDEGNTLGRMTRYDKVYDKVISPNLQN